jgi:multidrug efflux pump
MKSATDAFIRRPVLALVINLVILAVGFKAIGNLPVQQYPSTELSSIQITTIYPGASAETMRGFVTTPIERAVSAINGVDYVESLSTAGASRVTVRLRLNYSGNAGLAEVTARLQQIRGELPNASEPPIVELQRADRPYATFYIAFTSEALSMTQLSEFLSRQAQPMFGTLPGVQRAGLEGPHARAMRVWLKPERLASLGVTPEEVDSALRRNNFLSAVGRSKGATQVDLIADTDLRTTEEFRQLIVREREGSLIRLGDLADVELGSEEPEAAAKFNRRDAVWVSVWPAPGANELDVAKQVKKAMADFKPSLPPDVTMDLAYDGTMYMDNAISEIGKTLVETVGIVALVVFLFMGSVRTALVPLVAMPVSLVGAALFMLAFGFSLNLLTLLAIVLAVGLVVDDAIVVVENVERHIREGKSNIHAAILGARELAAPVISMTITLAAVYAPLGIQGGLTGTLFREFAFTLAAAVIVSGVVALTLSPVMSAYLVRSGRPGFLTRLVNGVFEVIRRVYVRLLDLALSVRPGVIIGAFVFMLLAPPLYLFSGAELAPTEDQGGVTLILDAAPDASLEYTSEQGRQICDKLDGVPEGSFIWQVIMGRSGFGGLQLVPWNERKRTAFEIQGEIFGRVSKQPGLRIFPVLPPALPGAGNFDVELYILSNDDVDVLAPIANQLVGKAFESGMFMFADTDVKLDLPQTRLVLDRAKVADLGLDMAKIGGELAVMMAGGYTNRFNSDGRSYKVIAQVRDSDRARPEQLLDLKVSGRNGELIPVSTFAKLQTQAGPRTLNRFQQKNAIKVYGAVPPGVTKEAALAVLEEEARKILPPGATLDYAGESRQIRKEGNSLAVTLGFALILIYLVLAAQFGSFRDPLIVLAGSVPLALSGALVITFVGLTTVNIYSQVGLITLVGLVAKNGILIVEFANHMQEAGHSKWEAARLAASSRLRPVLMTSFATVFGHLPLVFVSGAGASARNSIGIVLVAGMTIGTFFTLFVVPALYTLIAVKRERHVEGSEVPV